MNNANAAAEEIVAHVEREVAAVGIQRAFVVSHARRGVFSVLDAVCEFVEQRTTIASIRMQGMARKRRGRRLVRLWGERFVLETDKATAIQAWTRSQWGRRKAAVYR